MKLLLRGSTCLIGAFSLLVFSTTTAFGLRARGHRPPPKPVYTAIISVSSAAMTVTVGPKNSTGTTPKIYRFTPQTRITINGQPATAAALKPGQRVRLGLGADSDLAEELEVTSPPPGAGKPKHAKRPST